MQRETKKLLKEVVENLKSHSNGELWDVLTALRGPDWPDFRLKLATTGLIRRKLYGAIKNIDETHEVYNETGLQAHYFMAMGGLVTVRDTAALRDIRIAYRSGVTSVDIHFLSHSLGAFNVLGLFWSKVNEL